MESNRLEETQSVKGMFRATNTGMNNGMGNRKKRMGLLGASALTLILLTAFTYGLWVTLGWRLGDDWPWKLERTGTNQYSVTRLALFIVAGVVGVVGVVVAYRRQLGIEEGQFLERLADSARQLGDQNPTIQAAGIYALAGLADAEGRARRQQCVDVLCAYLRLPYTPSPAEVRPGTLTTVVQKRTRRTHTGPVEEQHTLTLRPHDWETRQSIMRIIAQHIRTGAGVSWSDLNFDFSNSVIDYGDFDNGIFTGSVSFRGATFSNGNVSFAKAKFTRCTVDFRNATFISSSANFHSAKFFRCTVDFEGVTFSNSDIKFNLAKYNRCTVDFNSVKYVESIVKYNFVRFTDCVTYFDYSQFLSGIVDYSFTKFIRSTASFTETQFAGAAVDFFYTKFVRARTSYSDAHFTGGHINFNFTKFAAGIRDFGGFSTSKRFNKTGFVPGFQNTQFAGAEVTFTEVKFNNGTPGFEKAKFTDGVVTFTRTKFTRMLSIDLLNDGFSHAKFINGVVHFNYSEFINGAPNFNSAEFTGSTVDFKGSRFVNQFFGISMNDLPSRLQASKVLKKIVERMETDSTSGFFLAAFTGGIVDFTGANFDGGTVSFVWPEDWSTPPRVPWEVGDDTPDGVLPSPWPPASERTRDE